MGAVLQDRTSSGENMEGNYWGTPLNMDEQRAPNRTLNIFTGKAFIVSSGNVFQHRAA